MLIQSPRGLLQSLRVSMLERYETLSAGILSGATTTGDYSRQIINCGGCWSRDRDVG